MPNKVTRTLKLGLAAIAWAWVAGTAYAEEAKSRETSATVVSNTLFRPPSLKPSDTVYRDLFAGADDSIRQTYVDRWRYHEIQSGYSRTSVAPQVHLDPGTFSVTGNGPLEADVRSEFARTAFRMRIESAFRAFLNRENNAGVKRAHQFVEGLKAQSFSVSKDGTAGEFRFGYDVITDASRFEYVKGGGGGGVYHSHLIGSLTGSKPLLASVTVNVWQEFGLGLPRGDFGYNLDGRFVQLGLSKPLAPTLRGEAIAVKPVTHNGVPDSVLLRMIYTF